MAYVTVEQVRANMRSLPSDFPDADIELFIEQAETIINGYLYDSFEVPFSPTVPNVIETIALNLTVYLLAESLYSSYQPNLDQYQVKRYERAMELLKQISEGMIVLDGYPLSTKKTGSGYDTTIDGEIFFTIDPEEEW